MTLLTLLPVSCTCRWSKFLHVVPVLRYRTPSEFGVTCEAATSYVNTNTKILNTNNWRNQIKNANPPVQYTRQRAQEWRLEYLVVSDWWKISGRTSFHYFSLVRICVLTTKGPFKKRGASQSVQTRVRFFLQQISQPSMLAYVYLLELVEANFWIRRRSESYT